MNLTDLKDKQTLRMMGLMTGTSMDGLDICVADVTFSDNSVQCELVKTKSVSFPQALRQKIRQALTGSTDHVTRIHYELGRYYADQTHILRSEASIKDIDAVALHGQTIHHISGVATLQVGEPSFLAEVLGLPVISDFRARDISAGGTGAPLIPVVDKWLLQQETKAVICLNLGGIANVTFLPPTDSGLEIMGFDTGPGMSLLDEVAGKLLHEPLDAGGSKALSGTADEKSVSSWMSDRFVLEHPPKSTGRDYFGAVWLEKYVSNLSNWEPSHLLASLSLFTARAVAVNCHKFLSMDKVSEVIVSGGGVHNQAVMRWLKKEFAPITVITSDQYGIDPDTKEALGFAILGAAYLKGIPGNLPAVTGANHPVVLGKLTV
ncbi:MAG: anhydro-N-acetylmuramic acid kinase [Fidelibacterota bacterium]